MNVIKTCLRYIFKGPVISVTEPQFNRRKILTNAWDIDMLKTYNSYYKKNQVDIEAEKKYESQPFYYFYVTYENCGKLPKVFFGEPGTSFEEQEAVAKRKAEKFYNRVNKTL